MNASMLPGPTSPADRGISYRVRATCRVAIFIILLVDAHVWFLVGYGGARGAEPQD